MIIQLTNAPIELIEKLRADTDELGDIIERLFCNYNSWGYYLDDDLIALFGIKGKVLFNMFHGCHKHSVKDKLHERALDYALIISEEIFDY